MTSTYPSVPNVYPYVPGVYPSVGLQRLGLFLKRLGLGRIGGVLSGATVSTVEHLMAALSGLGIDNAKIRLSESELPVLDGSSYAFIEALSPHVTEVP
eukprot:CAMPEP_0173436480 /NCGR_PEP_ID=MMETSP1357-20121228/16215_1 /TAXON_ID=77926 /ORGANISM="Hemiselmis rufescens, Strain PCC563" /LENGTH=97 /DNA_ID=CAMNT_0014401561 /DNA_START=98 /DNA_END=387 /DNA_ORIENTATION=+